MHSAAARQNNISQRKLMKKARQKRVNRSLGGNIVLFSIVAVLGVFMAFPMIYTVGNYLKPLDELWRFPPTMFPRNPTYKNFVDIFVLLQSSWVPVTRYIFNTVFITAVGTFGHVIIASMCAYPLAKYRFPGSKIIFSVITLSLMFSTAVTSIPNYLIMVKLNWIDTYQALIVPAFGSSLGLFLMKQFMEQLPTALIEAAKIDGSSEWHLFWHIIMPNVKSAWLTLVVFSVQALWNTGANIFTYKEELKTLPYAISQIVSGGIARACAGAAVTVILIVVPVVTFVITQRRIIETMASSGIKE